MWTFSLPTTSDLTHPALQLKGFTKIRDLGPGCRRQAGQVRRKIQDLHELNEIGQC